MRQDVEAVILTGGASRRMGLDKASISVDGVPCARRIADRLAALSIPLTVLGPSPIGVGAHLPDPDRFEGPLSALARFLPSLEFCLVVSCDIPGFDAGLVSAFCEQIGTCDAIIPTLEGRLQPLCALYRASTWATLRQFEAAGEKRVMLWVGALDVAAIDERGLEAAGLSPNACRGFNTPEEFEALLTADQAEYR